jgi:hypothetical protein
VRIFVSYRREDTAAYAGRLYDALVGRFGDENVFMDVDTIDLGSDFREVIDRAIASCDVTIALIGRNWLSATDAEGERRLDDPDDLLRLELERALARGLVIVPACVQAAELPSEDALPASLAPLSSRQGIELRDTAWRDDVDRLTRRLERIADETPRPEAGARSARWGPRRGLALALALAALAAVLVLALRGGDGDGSGAAGGTTAAERELLAVVPLAIRSDCEPVDYGPESAQASVSCGAPRTSISYHRFGTAPVMDAWYELSREDASITPDSGRCVGTAFRGEAPYAAAGKTIGRYFCWVDGKQPELVWTDRRARVGAEANVWKGTGQAAAESLLRQWHCCLQLEP